MRPYKTAHTEAKTERIINRSRFISQCFPVRSEDEALSRLNEVRKQYPDATHVCYAYRIGELSETTRFSDAGEPSGTAGMPILEVLKANELTYVLCTVTRYFGGILLGAGGLVRAYTSSAKLALEAAGIADVREMLVLEVRMAYSYLAKMKNLAGEFFSVENISYTDSIVMQLSTEPENEERLKAFLADMTAGSARIISEKVEFVKVRVI